MPDTTTHLVCAPDDLATVATVIEWLAHPGATVLTDTPLVRLSLASGDLLVPAPMAGVVTEHCVVVGEVIVANDLIAMIEAEEPHFGNLMVAADDAAANLSVPACKLVHPETPPSSVSPEALALCAALGLAPAEVPRQGAALERPDVERHARAELRLLASLRQLIGR
ncbi:biotin/lipoyl-containing protein [Chitinimonas sp. BJYL2]|uniref:biotin/lipoyl-containing protein n=1 Tax=Chitinimonas sp. BJYL2 TaxID=2976696 RepID=UPI0022B30FC6|nr:biotin/lipoyl-containing protein [Chitinimonas sp. BJYL2]